MYRDPDLIFIFLPPNCCFNFLFPLSSFSILSSKIRISFLPGEEASSYLVCFLFFYFSFCYFFSPSLFLDGGKDSGFFNGEGSTFFFGHKGSSWATTLTLFFSILPPTGFSSDLFLTLTLENFPFSLVVSPSPRAFIAVSTYPSHGASAPSMIKFSQLLPCCSRAYITQSTLWDHGW